MAQIEIKLTDDSGTDAALVLESVAVEGDDDTPFVTERGRIALYVTASGDNPVVYLDAEALVNAARVFA